MRPHPFPFHPFTWGHLLFAGLAGLLWLALLALIIYALVRAFSRPRAYAPPPMPGPMPAAAPAASGSAIELLRRRYAAGEIDATTFEQMLERLVASEGYEQSRGGQTPPPMPPD
ncbi:MAG TPA: SHOCT domain-containing protein, partial [Ktedonobacterales bacterium]|nr:SHOCT domain-containing protein [Ktedonobacterales bacterium]